MHFLFNQNIFILFNQHTPYIHTLSHCSAEEPRELLKEHTDERKLLGPTSRWKCCSMFLRQPRPKSLHSNFTLFQIMFMWINSAA